MNAALPPNAARRSSISASSASSPATVPAMAYCEPLRLKLAISRNSPVRSATPSTNAATSSSAMPSWDGRIAASR